jgi:hypothetical protein
VKYLCEGCERLVAPATFRLEEGGALVLACERCGALTRSAPVAGQGAQAPERDGARAQPAGAALQAAAAHASAPEREAAQAPLPEAPRASLAPAPRDAAPSEPPRRAPDATAPAASPGEAPRPPALRVVSLRPSEASVRQAAQLARAEDPFAPPPGHCPKCLAPRPEDSLICTRCGLVYANFRPEAHRPSAPLGEAWVALLASWDDEERHQRFVQLALARGELAGAGRLYRLRLVQAPQDVFAQRGRDEVLRLASASSAAALSLEHAEAAPPSRARAALVAGLVLFLLLAAVLLVRQLQLMLSAPSP